MAEKRVSGVPIMPRSKGQIFRNTISIVLLVLMPVMMVTGCDSMNLQIPDENVVYIAFGDSTTAGPSDKDYHEYLREKLGAEANTFANRGHSGERTPDGIERLKQLLDRNTYPNAQVLLFWEGGGDLVDIIHDLDPFLLSSPNSSNFWAADELDEKLDDIRDNLIEAIQLGRDAGLTVYVANYFDIQDSTILCEAMQLDILLPGQAALANEYVALLNNQIQLAALAGGAELVDVSSVAEELASDSSNYENCTHLSEKGNEIAAEVFYEEMSK